MNKVIIILTIFALYTAKTVYSELTYDNYLATCNPFFQPDQNIFKHILMEKMYFNEKFWFEKINDTCFTIILDKNTNELVKTIESCSKMHNYICIEKQFAFLPMLINFLKKFEEKLSLINTLIKSNEDKNKKTENEIKQQFIDLHAKLSYITDTFNTKIENVKINKLDEFNSNNKDFFDKLKDILSLHENNNDAMQSILLNHKNYAVLPTISLNGVKSEYIEGDELYIECIAEGHPIPDIYWIKAKQENMPEILINNESLRIFDLSKNNTGIYKCMADNKVGNPQEKVVQIDVLYKPVLVPLSETIPFLPNRSIEIKCEIDSNPKVDHTYWILNNNTKVDSLAINVNNKIITNLTLNTNEELNLFIGDYSCCAKNKLGYECKEIKLYEEPPKNVELKISSTELPSVAKLTILAYSKTNLKKVFITYKSINSVYWKDIIITDLYNKSFTYNISIKADLYIIETIIDDLLPTEVYQFKIKIFNNQPSQWIPSESYEHQNKYICSNEEIYANIKPLYLISHIKDNHKNIKNCETRIRTFSSMAKNIRFNLLSDSDNINLINYNTTQTYLLTKTNNTILVPNLYFYDIKYSPPKHPKGFTLKFEAI